MKGAIAEPWLKIINPPNNAKKIMIGKSQYFFLIFKKFQNSIKKLIFKTDFSLKFYYPFFYRPETYYLFFHQIDRRRSTESSCPDPCLSTSV